MEPRNPLASSTDDRCKESNRTAGIRRKDVLTLGGEDSEPVLYMRLENSVMVQVGHNVTTVEGRRTFSNSVQKLRSMTQ